MTDPGRVARAVVAVAVVLALAALALVWFGRRDRASTGSAGNPFLLVVSSAHATPDAASALQAALATRSGLTVRVVRLAPGAGAVSMAGTESFDAGLLPLFEYLLARQQYGVRARLQVVRGESREYAGELLVRDDSPIRTLADLRGRRVAFVDQASTTGYLLPARTLKRAGVDVVAIFAGTHDDAIAALTTASVDAAATFAAPRPGLRRLAATGSVPNEPLFFSKSTPRGVADRIAAALVDLGSTPDGRELLGRIAGISGFAPVTDEAYRPVHDLLRDTERSLPDLVPGGRELVEWNQRFVGGL